MQTTNENHIIYPTYQSVLISTISTVIDRMNNGQTFEAWLAIRNLYRWMPTDCQNEVKPQFEAVIKELNRINITTRHLDFNMVTAERHRRQEKYLFEANEILCDAIRQSLGKHNWLDRDGTIKPRNQEVPTI